LLCSAFCFRPNNGANSYLQKNNNNTNNKDGETPSRAKQKIQKNEKCEERNRSTKKRGPSKEEEVYCERLL
jgi:hypothetical protein